MKRQGRDCLFSPPIGSRGAGHAIPQGQVPVGQPIADIRERVLPRWKLPICALGAGRLGEERPTT